MKKNASAKPILDLADKVIKDYMTKTAQGEPPAKKKVKGPLYFGIFLDDANHNELMRWWREDMGQLPLDTVFGHHMTSKFAPSPEDVEKYTPLIGQTFQVKITGYAADDKGQAVSVDTDADSSNKVKHITISCATGTKPVYSNELLAKETKPVDNGPTLTAVFDQFPRTVK